MNAKTNKLLMVVAIVGLVVFFMKQLFSSTETESEGFLGWKNIFKEGTTETTVSGISADEVDGSPMELSDPLSAKINVPHPNKSMASSLLPQPHQGDDFAEFAPVNIEGAKLVDASKYVRGMTSQSLRNSNMQLRPEPANPHNASSCVWNQSTIVPDHA